MMDVIIRLESSSRFGWVRVIRSIVDDASGGAPETNELPWNHPVLLTLCSAADAAMKVDAPPDWVVAGDREPPEYDWDGE